MGAVKVEIVPSGGGKSTKTIADVEDGQFFEVPDYWPIFLEAPCGDYFAVAVQPGWDVDENLFELYTVETDFNDDTEVERILELKSIEFESVWKAE